MIDFARIVSIKTLRLKVEEATNEMDAAGRPILLDWSLIPKVHDCFVEYAHHEGICPDDFTKRRQFIFIALYLFAPKVLVGGKMPIGLRDRLCDALSLNARTALSNQVKDLIFFYQEYKDFRDGVNEAYAYIEERLGLGDDLNDIAI